MWAVYGIRRMKFKCQQDPLGFFGINIRAVLIPQTKSKNATQQNATKYSEAKRNIKTKRNTTKRNATKRNTMQHNKTQKIVDWIINEIY